MPRRSQHPVRHDRPAAVHVLDQLLVCLPEPVGERAVVREVVPEPDYTPGLAQVQGRALVRDPNQAPLRALHRGRGRGRVLAAQGGRVGHRPAPRIRTSPPLLTPPILTKLACLSEEITLCRLENRLDNYDVRRLMDAGCVIISSWIDTVCRIPPQIGTVCVYGVSFRMGRGIERMIATADISVYVPSGVILNVDADAPGSKVALIPSSMNESWFLRLCSAAGFGPGSGGGMGTIPATTVPPFFIVGLDIEVSTFARKGNMPLPHDDLISITISNGAWFEGGVSDVCYCVYTFGFHREVELDNGRKPVFVKAGSSAGAVVKAFEILNSLSPDFVNIHNGFGFDLQWLATHAAMVNGINKTFEDRRLGNTGEAVYWRLPNGVSFVDSMYDVDKYQRKDWDSIGLAYLASRMGVPSKLDADEMMLENSDTYDVTDMLVYNARDSDLHALLAKRMRMRMCERYLSLAGTSRSPIWDAIGGNTGYMVHCLEMSKAMSMGMCLDLSRSLDADEKEFEGGFNVMSVLNNPRPDDEKVEMLIKIVSRIMRVLQSGKLPVSAQVAEVKINVQPHIVYVDNYMKKRSILIGIGVKASDVNKKWVAKRIASAIDSVIAAVGLGTVSQLLFIYESKRNAKVVRS
ncbi:hypothetical protein LTR12_016432 [Friedmanniomyces endolithicus]|nr:hypothetical protein LTR12_016432 [Friedmanniomyces endolithicus]